jgi:TfoX/Sxy family transcriptional regulator of competence genes
MAYSEKLAERIRRALSGIRNIEEKKMFRGIAFMLNDKMCVTVGDNEMMCRIDPDLHEASIKRKGCRTVKMKGLEYKGWVLVSEEGMKTKKDFDHWINLALDFNKRAKSSKTGKA